MPAKQTVSGRLDASPRQSFKVSMTLHRACLEEKMMTGDTCNMCLQAISC